MSAGWTRRGVGRGAVIAIVSLGAGAGLGYAIAHEPAPEPSGPRGGPQPEPTANASASARQPRPRRPAGDAERALVAPWKEGFTVGEFTVARLEGVDGGVFRVVLEREHGSIAMIVAAHGETGPNPPARTERFDVFYQARAVTPAEAEMLARALAKVLEANGDAQPPAGLGPFAPDSGGGIEL
jgi:hypothetical protein